MSSSYLLTDTTMDEQNGLNNWDVGLHRLIDIVVALHATGELEAETYNSAAKACAECWSVAGSWRNLEPAKDCVRRVAAKLKRLMDENGKTYKGEPIYVQ